jgi:hypothetical protein
MQVRKEINPLSFRVWHLFTKKGKVFPSTLLLLLLLLTVLRVKKTNFV